MLSGYNPKGEIQWISHSRNIRENWFRGILVTKSPLRIGAGREPPFGSAVELAVLKITREEIPYIPGSSLKGVFRGFAYVLMKKKNLKTCKDNDCLLQTREELKEEFEKLRKEPVTTEKFIEEFDRRACLLCKIFGSQGYRSKVNFFDAYPVKEGEGYLFKTGIRKGIRIDRKSGAVVSRALYEVEYIEPGSKFYFEIFCSNLPNYALGLLSKTILCLNKGETKVGGFKSRGFGEVGIEELEFISTEGKTMKALDIKDKALENLPFEKEGWWIARGEKAWEIIKMLAGVWDEFSG